MAGQLRFIGLDLAWSASNPTGACTLDAVGNVIDERMLGSDDEIVNWINASLDGAAVVDRLAAQARGCDSLCRIAPLGI